MIDLQKLLTHFISQRTEFLVADMMQAARHELALADKEYLRAEFRRSNAQREVTRLALEQKDLKYWTVS